MDDFLTFLSFTFFAVIIMLLVVLGIIFIDVYCFENVPVKCFIDGVLVYDGVSAGINVDSSGDTTTVRIFGGFLYIFPKAYFVSQNVRLEGDKRIFKKQGGK